MFKPVIMAGGMAKRMTKAEKIAYGGGAVAMSTAVGGGVSMSLMALAVPVIFIALLFLPLTLMAGVSGSSDARMRKIVLFSSNRLHGASVDLRPRFRGVLAVPSSIRVRCDGSGIS